MRKKTFILFIIVSNLIGATHSTSAVPINWVRKADSPIQMNFHYGGVIGNTWYHAGGSPSGNVGRTWCQAYDLEHDVWFPMASMNKPHRAHGVVAFGGKLYAFGGISYFSTFHPELEVYRPDLDSWSYLSPMPVALRYFGCAQSGGRIYVTGGGIAGTFQPQNSLWIYDIGSDTWSLGTPMPTTLQSHCSTAHCGRIYTFGGYDTSYNAIDLVQVYDVATATWSNGPVMPVPTIYSGATVLDGRIYVIGGQDSSGSFRTVQIYEPQTEMWDSGTDLPVPGSQAAVDVYDGKLYVYFRGRTYEGTLWEVAIDIKPGSCPNPLNTKDKGVLPVAVLGSAEHDVSTIDVASIRLEDVAPIRSNYEDVSAPVPDSNDECECTTEGPDGYLDLVLKFNTQDIIASLGEVNDGDELQLNLTGALAEVLGGTPIEGQDCVLIISKDK